MEILFLGPDTSPVFDYLRQVGEVRATSEPLLAPPEQYEFLVSHGYRHILPRDICEAFDGRAVNLHISMLPWNRGADPNLWSHIDNTPTGVSIHYIAPGLDTGDIVAQREVRFDSCDTIGTSYAKLQEALCALFREHWPQIKAGTCQRIPQTGNGSYHRSAEKARVAHLLPNGWDTSLAALQGANREQLNTP